MTAAKPEIPQISAGRLCKIESKFQQLVAEKEFEFQQLYELFLRMGNFNISLRTLRETSKKLYMVTAKPKSL